MMLSQTQELDEKGILPPHSPLLSPCDQGHLVLLLNCYPHFLDQTYAPVTRGHNLRLNKFMVKYDLHKYYFTSRIVNVWNSLSSFVVSADSVNCFKNRLDKFWCNQDIIYDYQAEIQGTGNRSEVVL